MLRHSGWKGGVDQPGGERSDRPCMSGCCQCQRGDPPRGLTQRSRTQIAAGTQQDGSLSSGERRPQLTLLLGGKIGVDGQRTIGEGTVSVTQEGLGRWGSRQQALAGADNDQQIEGLPDGERQGPDVNSDTDAANAARRTVELGLQRVSEHGASDRRGKRIEPTETVERRLHGNERLVLVGGQRPDTALAAQPACEETMREVGPVLPGQLFVRPPQLTAKVGDECLKLERGGGVVSVAIGPAGTGADAVRTETLLPVGVTGQPGLARHTLPLLARYECAVGRTRRHVRQQREQIGAADAAAIEPQQIEHEPRSQALVQRNARPTVPRDACCVEMLADEAGIGLVARPHDADAMQRRALMNGGHDAAHGLARLFIGIGGIDNFQGNAVGREVLALQEDHFAALGERVEQRLLCGPHTLREEHHGAGRRRIHRSACSLQQIGLVVPLVGEGSVHLGAQPADFTSPNGALLGEMAAQWHGEMAQVAVGGAQRGDGGLVVGDRFEHAS